MTTWKIIQGYMNIDKTFLIEKYLRVIESIKLESLIVVHSFVWRRYVVAKT